MSKRLRHRARVSLASVVAIGVLGHLMITLVHGNTYDYIKYPRIRDQYPKESIDHLQGTKTPEVQGYIDRLKDKYPDFKRHIYLTQQKEFKRDRYLVQLGDVKNLKEYVDQLHYYYKKGTWRGVYELSQDSTYESNMKNQCSKSCYNDDQQPIFWWTKTYECTKYNFKENSDGRYRPEVTKHLYILNITASCSKWVANRQNFPSVRCVDCQGEWSGWKPLYSLRNSGDRTTYDPEAFCGIRPKARKYKVTTPQSSLRGSKACPHADGHVEIQDDVVETCKDLDVKIQNPAKVVMVNDIDFGIEVYHDTFCGKNQPCHLSNTKASSNIDCEAWVRRKDITSHSHNSIRLPYKKLTRGLNFIDPETDSRRIRLTTDGVLKAGDYVLEYRCSIKHFKVIKEEQKLTAQQKLTASEVSKNDDRTIIAEKSGLVIYGEKVVKTYMSQTQQGSHEFKIVDGCQNQLPFDTDTSLLSTHLLLTSSEYLSAKCDELIHAKESIFRKYDIAPTNGELDVSELTVAFATHHADTSAIEYLIVEGKPLSLTLGQLMQANVFPFHCTQSTKQAVKMTKTTLPSVASGRGTTKSKCETGAQNAAARWSFHQELTREDVVCVYVDGFLKEVNHPTTNEPDKARAHLFSKFEKNGFYALRGVEDRRQTFGANEDVHATLVAQFTFGEHDQGSTATSIIKNQNANKLHRAFTLNFLQRYELPGMFPCQAPMAGRCLEVEKYRLYDTDWGSIGSVTYPSSFVEAGFSFSMWFYRANSDFQYTFSSISASCRHLNWVWLHKFEESCFAKFYMFAKDKALAVRHRRSDKTYEEISLKNAFGDPFSEGWYLVGFSFLEQNQGVRIFSYPMDNTKNFSHVTSRNIAFNDFRDDLSTSVNGKEHFQCAVHFVRRTSKETGGVSQYNDIRFFSGIVQEQTFEAIRQCGGKSHCAQLARAAPGTRRVVCVTNRFKGKSELPPACVTSLYYDGTAIDVEPSMDLMGVRFSFRDTAWDETAFEIERVALRDSGGEFETVVSIGNNLKGCASVFNSITYLDRDAVEVPYTQWKYRIVSKFDRTLSNGLMYFVSKSVLFTTPWTNSIGGTVFAGGSTTPVPYVRVCAEFKKKIAEAAVVGLTNATERLETDLAQNRRAVHSLKQYASEAHVVTSTKSEGHVTVPNNEFLRIDLGAWASVESITVCTVASGADAEALRKPPNVQAYVHDTDADLNKTSHGHMCSFASPQWQPRSSSITCAKFSCIGSKIKSFHGQFVDVVATTTDGVQISKVQAFGNETRCRFGAITGTDGRYELNIHDSKSNIPIKSKLHIGAYKEEINAQELVAIELDGEPAHSFFYFRNVADARPWPYGRGTPWDFVTDDDWADRATVEAQLFKTFFSVVTGSGDDDSTAASAQVRITDSIWRKTFDVNGDGKVHVKEARYILEQLDDDAGTKTNFVFEPLIVLPPFDASDITPKPFGEFHATANATGCEILLLVYRDSKTLPETPAEWRKLYSFSVDEIGFRDYLTTGSTPCHDITPERRVNTTVVGSPSKFILPMIMWLPGSRKAPLISPLKRDDKDAYENFVSSMRLRAMQRRPDVIHVFDKLPKLTQTDASTESSDGTAEIGIMENIFSSSAMTKRTIVDVKHKRVEEKDFTDDTTVVIKGAVLFPQSRVHESTACGLSSAIIEVIDAEGNVESHKTDIKGNFKLALTRGKTFVLRAKYQDHFICYAGDTVEMAVTDAQGCASLEREHYERLLVNNDDAEKTYPHSAHRLVDVSDDHFVYFTDVTRSKIDLGVYQGECEKKYRGIKYSIEPTNGCHGAVEVDHDVLMQTPAPSEDDVEYSWWPYAAMEYKIRLVDAPSVKKVKELIKDETYASGCTTELTDDYVLDIQTYFEEKAEDIKVLKMQDEVNGVSARYKYHGHFCVNIMDIPVIDDENSICYDKTESTGTLTHQHFLGTTNYTNFAQNIDGTEKLVRVQVFEVHGNVDLNGDSRIETCAIFPSEELGTGSTTVKFRQDVTDEANNPCHSKRPGGPLCDFALQLDPDSEQVLFPLEGGGTESATLIASGTPNLVSPFRRNVQFKVTRYDNWTPISMEVKRHLISLGSKVRGSEYELSDDTNWATVPIDGLVYTVVHDPPGGDSYAELATESRIGLEFELAGVRAASRNQETDSKEVVNEKFELGTGIVTGYGLMAQVNSPVNMIDIEGTFDFATSGPKVEMQSTSSSGWSLETTTNRVLRSSQDVALPGRAGDVILGGGIELVYKISDVLDVQMDGSSKDCLLVKPYITWLPRKPTSYVFIVATIEQQVLPNLRFLLSTVLAGGVLEDSSDMAFPCDANGDDDTGPIGNCTQTEIIDNWSEYLAERIDGWERTLQWSSPSIFKLVTGEGESKQEKKTYKSIERISAPMDDDASVFGQNMAAKTKYFTDAFIDTPIDDVMEDLKKTWDASFWMMPYNGIGPPSMFGSPDFIAEEYWEPSRETLEGQTPAETNAIIHGGSALHGDINRALHSSIVNGGLRTSIKKTLEGTLEDGIANKKGIMNVAANSWKELSKFSDLKFNTKKQTGTSTMKVKTVSSKDAAKVQSQTKKATAKSKKGTAAKLLFAAAMLTRMEVMKATMKETTYPYISYPRAQYRNSIPTARSAFYDEDDENYGNAGHVENNMYSWGMMTSSVNDLMSNFTACPNSAISCAEKDYAKAHTLLPESNDHNKALGEDGNIAPYYDERVVASFTGGTAYTGMKVRGLAGKYLSDYDTILLTFSGGGHSVEFSLSSEEATSKNHYELHMGVHAEASNAHDMEIGGLLGIVAAIAMLATGHDNKQKWTFTKDMSSDRSFFWNKYGKLSTLYSLGDPNLGDKFVVQVASDTRFGTPVFITKGGRSLCPGEPFTVWRQAGIKFMSRESMELTDLNPDDRAIMVLSIKNEAMHREATTLGLRLVDGLIETVHEIVDVAYANADASRSAEDVLQSVQDVANSSVARDAPVVRKMVTAAKNAVNANKNAFEVAADVNDASADAPALGSEMHDLEFLVMYEWLPPLGDVVPLKFSDGDSLRSQKHARKTSFTMSIGRGPTALSKLKYLRLQLVSLCEFDLNDSTNLYRAPIGDTISLGTISWLTNCPEVSFTKKTLEDHEATQYISRQQPDQPIFEFGVDFDASSDNLEKVLLQYRKPGEEWDAWRRTDGEQMNLKTNFIEKGGLFQWNINDNKLLSGFNDGEYEVRAKSFCTGGSNVIPSTQYAITNEVLTLVVDTTPPFARRRDVYDDYAYSIVFSEAIDCKRVALSLTKTNSRCSGDAEGVEMSLVQTSVQSVAEIRCSTSNIVAVLFNAEASGTYAVDIANIADLSGNAMKQEALKFDANVNCDLAKKADLSPEERKAARLFERQNAPKSVPSVNKTTKKKTKKKKTKKKATALLAEHMQYVSAVLTNQSITAATTVIVLCVVVVGAARRFRDRSTPTMKKPAVVQSYGAVDVSV